MIDRYLSVLLPSNRAQSIFTPLLLVWAVLDICANWSVVVSTYATTEGFFFFSAGPAETVLGLKSHPLTLFLSVCSSLQAFVFLWLLHPASQEDIPMSPSPPSLPSSHLPALSLSFSFLSWHLADLWPEGSKGGLRKGGSEQTGRREETWKEGAGEGKRKGASRGGVGKRGKTPESEAMIWLLLLSSGEGREEYKYREREQERMGGNKEGSPY